MTEFFTWFALYSVLFGASFYGARFLLSRARRPVEPPPIHTKVRLRAGASVLESQLLEVTRNGWVVSPPRLKSDMFPMRPTDAYLVEFTDENGLGLFHSRILRREGGSNPTVLLRAPDRILRRERREHPRVKFDRPISMLLDESRLVTICNMGPGGAKVRCSGRLAPGSSVRLREVNSPASLSGWVLDIQAADGESEARIVFHREIPLDFVWSLASKTA